MLNNNFLYSLGFASLIRENLKISCEAKPNSRFSSRKSQMEIMGLAIIMILVGLGLLFAVQFVLKPSQDTTARVKESVLAANFLNTILSTNTPCLQRNIKELLQDCALTGGIIECPERSCEYAGQQIKQILENTLEVWRKDYKFSITGAPEVSKITFAKGKCTGDKEAKEHPVPIKPGFNIVLRLEICAR